MTPLANTSRHNIVVGLLACCTLGCSEARYDGYAPSYRTVSDRAEGRNAYLGLNIKYAVDTPTEYHGLSGRGAEPVISTTAIVVDEED